MAGPLPIIGAGVSLLVKQFVKRKAKSVTPKRSSADSMKNVKNMAANRRLAKTPKKQKKSADVLVSDKFISQALVDHINKTGRKSQPLIPPF